VDENASPHDVAVYASRRADGAYAVLLLNKTSSSHDVTLSFVGASVAGKPTSTTTLAPASAGQDTSTSILFNGAADPSPTGLPPAAMGTAAASPVVSLPAYGAAAVVLGP